MLVENSEGRKGGGHEWRCPRRFELSALIFCNRRSVDWHGPSRFENRNNFRHFENFYIGVNRLVDILVAGMSLLWWLLQYSTREGSWPF